MSIQFTRGDITRSGRAILVNTVNCVGVMGKGLALQYKQLWPRMYREYRAYCLAGRLRPGGLYIWQGPGGVTIVNFATKDHWRDSSQYDWIVKGLSELHEWLRMQPEYLSVAIPPLGCGLGGLEWETVKDMIQVELSDLPQHIYVYEP